MICSPASRSRQGLATLLCFCSLSVVKNNSMRCGRKLENLFSTPLCIVSYYYTEIIDQSGYSMRVMWLFWVESHSYIFCFFTLAQHLIPTISSDIHRFTPDCQLAPDMGPLRNEIRFDER